jgi:acyl-CoA thioesterase
MNLFDLLASAQSDRSHVVIPSQWSQGRACYGGLMAALLYEAMAAKAPGRPVRSLAITFVGPAQAEVPISFEVELLREGKAVTSLLGRAVQGGQVMTLIQGSFGLPRDSQVSFSNAPVAEMKSLEQSTPVPYIEGLTPEYIRHLDMRWGIGGMPFSNTPSPAIGGWVQLRGEVPDAPVDEAHLLALVDAWPPALVTHLDRFAPGSSLTWTIEFVQPLPAASTRDWFRYRANIEHARDGYGHTAAALWTAEGQLLALSRQTVTVFG